MNIDDKLVRTAPEFQQMLDYLAAQRVTVDDAVKAIALERKEAQATVAELSAQLPALRQRYFSVLDDEKQSALEAVESAEDTIHVAENRRDLLDRQRLVMEQERCAHQVKLCDEAMAEIMPEMLPLMAKYAAILFEKDRQMSIQRTIPQRIGALELQQDTRNAERAQQVERERKRAASMSARRLARQEFAR